VWFEGCTWPERRSSDLGLEWNVLSLESARFAQELTKIYVETVDEGTGDR